MTVVALVLSAALGAAMAAAPSAQAAPQTTRDLNARPPAQATAPAAPRPQTGVAAGTLADPFGDRASQASQQPAAPAAQSTAPAAVVVGVAQSEAALRGAVAAFQAGEPDYEAMTPGLAEQVREREGEFVTLIQGFGALTSVDSMGEVDGGQQFLVLFDNAGTEWMIGLDPTGKIAALLFRPAAAPTAAN